MQKYIDEYNDSFLGEGFADKMEAKEANEKYGNSTKEQFYDMRSKYGEEFEDYGINRNNFF